MTSKWDKPDTDDYPEFIATTGIMSKDLRMHQNKIDDWCRKKFQEMFEAENNKIMSKKPDTGVLDEPLPALPKKFLVAAAVYEELRRDLHDKL
jgi:hypothetical protein